MSEAAFVYETEIATTPQRLWTALTTGTLTRMYWFDRRIESDWLVGSAVTFYDGDSDRITDTGVVLESVPPRKLVYSFRYEDGPVTELDRPYTRVTFELEPTDSGKVRLRLVHDQLASPDDVAGWRDGWTPILANLQAFLEGDRMPVAEPPRPSAKPAPTTA
ncbi:SRPBCC domain-containing protein [Plantactinospora sp. GCM10030261]|uniref:SRPBCC domain-containing protein n=1 Tax=Plantactinospora sp. GCM10030261 TaxID=3273420 RepID=UPI00360FB191